MRQSFAPAAFALSACLLMPLGAFAAPHPFSVEDLVRMQRVSEPALSPDGRTVVYTVRETDLAANRGRTDLWALDMATKGAQPRRLTTHPENDSSPEWSVDGREIYFLSTRSGSSQVWRLPANGGEAIQVTNLPLDVGSFRVASHAGRLAVTLEVFPDCADLACTVDRLDHTKNAKDSGEVYDRMFVRHWDTWSDGRISQLFVLQVERWRAPASLCRSARRSTPTCRPSRSVTPANIHSRPTAPSWCSRRASRASPSPGRPTSICMKSASMAAACAISPKTIPPGIRNRCSRATAPNSRGAQWSEPASKPIVSTSWSWI